MEHQIVQCLQAAVEMTSDSDQPHLCRKGRKGQQSWLDIRPPMQMPYLQDPDEHGAHGTGSKQLEGIAHGVQQSVCGDEHGAQQSVSPSTSSSSSSFLCS